MMIWLLRTLPLFRRLEEDSKRAVELRVRVADLERRNEELSSEVMEARKEQLQAVKTLANYAAQIGLQAVPFPEARTLPEAVANPPVSEPLPATFVTGGELVQQHNQRFLAKVRQLYAQGGEA